MIDWKDFNVEKPPLTKSVLTKNLRKIGNQYEITSFKRPYDQEPLMYNEDYYQILDKTWDKWCSITRADQIYWCELD